jgi:hypothetical protein
VVEQEGLGDLDGRASRVSEREMSEGGRVGRETIEKFRDCL